MKVRDILTQKQINGVESIGVHETVSTLVARLSEKKIGALVVTGSDGGLCGIISERDVVRGLAQDGDNCLRAPISKYMTADVVTAAPQDEKISVLEKMTAGRFRHVPIVDGGEVVGVVSIGDLVKARIEMLQKDNEALQEFIRG